MNVFTLRFRRRLLGVSIGILLPMLVCAQSPSAEISLTPLPLNDLSEFKSPDKNWEMAGDVYFDRAGNNKSNKLTKGKGVLVNQPTDKNKGNLLTNFEHSDLELEVEYMMAKGSNSGIYLQGRYEIQLADSWGMKHPKASDCGGIYQRWDDSKPEGQQGYQGYAPRVNVTRAPGLWQKLYISFQAPKFDAQGKKIENARMLRVVHNGVTIHENVELSGPTRGPIAPDEKPLGPLVIQGDHGAVAFKNIRYKNYDKAPVALTNLQYTYYEGKYDLSPDLARLTKVSAGKIPEMTWQVGNSTSEMAVQFTGDLTIVEPGTYVFGLQTAGGGNVKIDNQALINHEGSNDWRDGKSGTRELQAGKHQLSVLYFNKDSWRKPALGVFVEGPGIRRQMLSAKTAFPQADPTPQIYLKPLGEPIVHRSFVDYQPGKRIVHAVSVGDPSNVHYAVDLDKAAIFQVWKGEFSNATPMWNDRGDGSSRAMGSVVKFPDAPTLAVLSDNNAAWPDSMNAAAQFRIKGYELDTAGRPTFKYLFNGMTVEDRTMPEEDGKMLTREIKLNGNQAPANLYCRLASGTDITELSDGTYSVDGKTFYVKVGEAGGAKPTVRTVGNGKELLLLVKANGNAAIVTYSYIW